MGAIETAMLDCACAQVGKSLGLPTHAYLGATDSKVVDAQAGLESGISAMLGALCGINMISGAGMLDSLLCQSAEKLVLDAEGIAMARRLLDGVKARTESLATALFAGVDFEASRFLKQKATRQLFRQEQHLPGEVIDRDSLAGWTDSGALDTFARARACVTRLLASYRRPALDPAMERELTCLVEHLAAEAGMDRLPELRGEGCATPR
jgi:trimethylamine--corrinoid protein Co-methyltransferase